MPKDGSSSSDDDKNHHHQEHYQQQPVQYQQQPVQYQQQPVMYAQPAVVVVSPGGGPFDPHKVNTFLTVNIICVLLSIIFWPVVFIPMCFGIAHASDVNKARMAGGEIPLFSCSLTITLVVGTILLVLVIIIAIFTFGLGLILLIFVIPYFILASLHGTALCGYKPQRFDYSQRY